MAQSTLVMPKKIHMKRFADVILLLICAWLIFDWFDLRPVIGDSLMVVNRVHVDDFKTGDNPKVIYDRQVKKGFFAEWTAKIYPVNDINTLCQGHGQHYYRPEIEVYEVDLEWYLESDCYKDIPAGDYYIKTAWVTNQGPVIVNISNTFTVFDES